MQTVGEEIWALKLDILYIARCHVWEAFIDSKLEESLHLDLLDRLRSWNKKVKWPTEWNCPRNFLLYTMCSTCHSWRNACEYLKNKSHWKILLPARILPIKSILSNCWKRSKELHELGRFRCARFNGAAIQKKDPHVKEKKSWRQNSQTSFLSCPNLEGEIPFKWGRFITPRKFKSKVKLKSFYKS
jgi:hypothetical protein